MESQLHVDILLGADGGVGPSEEALGPSLPEIGWTQLSWGKARQKTPSPRRVSRQSQAKGSCSRWLCLRSFVVNAGGF